jgi:3-oxoadipate enol-lactonase
VATAFDMAQMVPDPDVVVNHDVMALSTSLTTRAARLPSSGMASVEDRYRHGFAWRERPDGARGEPLIVLLHGLGGSRISWEPQLAGLDGRRAVAWDLPGYGDSDPIVGELTFALLAEAVGRFVDVAAGEPGAPFHLAGISFGGMIAQYAAAAMPSRVQSLTLLSTSPAFGLDGTRPDEWRAARLAPLEAGEEPADFAAAVLSSLAGPHLGAAALAGQVAAMSRITAHALRRSIDVLVTHDSRSLLPTLTMPTVCMVGAVDTETPIEYAEAISDLVTGSKVIVVREAGHLLNVEAPAVVTRVLDEQARNARPARPVPQETNT